MRITKEKPEENRAALVRTAGRLFRERGIDGVGVAEISKEAGLTHGALYAHFPSKEALAAEALEHGLAVADARMHQFAANGVPDLSEFLDYYLAPEQRANIGGGCAMAASASEIGRQDTAVSARFTEGYARMARLLQGAGASRDADRRAGADHTLVANRGSTRAGFRSLRLRAVIFNLDLKVFQNSAQLSRKVYGIRMAGSCIFF